MSYFSNPFVFILRWYNHKEQDLLLGSSFFFSNFFLVRSVDAVQACCERLESDNGPGTRSRHVVDSWLHVPDSLLLYFSAGGRGVATELRPNLFPPFSHLAKSQISPWTMNFGLVKVIHSVVINIRNPAQEPKAGSPLEI